MIGSLLQIQSKKKSFNFIHCVPKCGWIFSSFIKMHFQNCCSIGWFKSMNWKMSKKWRKWRYNNRNWFTCCNVHIDHDETCTWFLKSPAWLILSSFSIRHHSIKNAQIIRKNRILMRIYKHMSSTNVSTNQKKKKSITMNEQSDKN